MTEFNIGYKPLVSVIMNCFNGDKYLIEAVESVINQSYENWEIIFWDNQSVDESANIIKSYKDPRIKYFYAPTHTLLYEARNYACEKANGSLLAFLDVDDTWLPQKLEQQIAVFSDHKIGFSFTNYWINEQTKKKKWLAFKWPMRKKIDINEILRFYNIGMLTLMVRRSVLPHQSIPFNPKFHIIGDFDLVIRLAVVVEFAFLQNPLAVYRIHGNNESIKRKELVISEFEYWVKQQRKNPQVVNACKERYLEIYLNYHKANQALLLSKRMEAYYFIKRMPWCYLKLKSIGGLLIPKIILNIVIK
jgi:glycosyltransferase involved in cell wall biosynthesis